MSSIVLKLKDSEMRRIDTMVDDHKGEYYVCSTCGFGGIRTNEVRMEFNNGKTIRIQSSTMQGCFEDDCEGNILTFGDIISIFSESTNFGQMSFDEFCVWISDKVKAIAPDGGYSEGTDVKI